MAGSSDSLSMKQNLKGPEPVNAVSKLKENSLQHDEFDNEAENPFDGLNLAIPKSLSSQLESMDFTLPYSESESLLDNKTHGGDLTSSLKQMSFYAAKLQEKVLKSAEKGHRMIQASEQNHSKIAAFQSKNASSGCSNCEIQALTVTNHGFTGSDNKLGNISFVIAGLQRFTESRNGTKSLLNLLVLNTKSMVSLEAKPSNQKPRKKPTSTDYSYVTMTEDTLFSNEYDSCETSDTGELSVINEYLKATKKAEAQVPPPRTDSLLDGFVSARQEFVLPDFIDPTYSRITRIYATKTSVFVVVKNSKMKEDKGTDKDTQQADSIVLSEVDSDTEVIDIEKESKASSDGVIYRACSYILEYRWSTSNRDMIVHESFVSSREFPFEECLNDAVLISSENSRFSEHRFDVIGEKICSDAAAIEVFIAAIGIERKRLMVISTIDFTNLSVIHLDVIGGARGMIENLVYCTGIGIVACCFDSGIVMLCDLDGQKESAAEQDLEQQPIPMAGVLNCFLECLFYVKNICYIFISFNYKVYTKYIYS